MNNALENVEELRIAYGLWHETRGGSAQHWLDLMADDVRIDSAAGGAEGMEFSQQRQGKAGAEQYFLGLAADWEMLYYNADEFIAQGDRVVVLGRCGYRYRATGKTAESAKVDVFRFRDGKIVEVCEFFDTATALAATRLTLDSES